MSSKIVLGPVLLGILSSALMYAQVQYTLNGTLEVASGSDVLALTGTQLIASMQLNQNASPSSSNTTSTFSTNTYTGATVALTLYANSPGAMSLSCPAATSVTLTDNFGAPDAINISNCTVLGSLTVGTSITIPDGYLITAVPAAIPSVSLVSGQVVLTFSSENTTYSLVNGNLMATGTPPPSVTPSLTAWTPTVVVGSTTPVSQNITFSASAPVSFSASAITVNGGSWLSVSPSAANSNSPITITVNPAILGTTIYDGNVILSYGPDYPEVTIPVTVPLGPASPPSVVSLVPGVRHRSGDQAALRPSQ